MSKRTKRRSRGCAPAVLLSLIIALLCAAVYLLTGAYSYLAAAAVELLCGIPLCIGLFARKRQAQQNTGVVCTMVGLVAVTAFLLAVPPRMHSDDLRQYRHQKSLAKLYQERAVTVPNWFPDFQDDVTGDYLLEYEPGVLHGNGYFSVRFRTEPERAASYAALFQAEARDSFLLSTYSDGMHLSLPDADAPAGTQECTLLLKPAEHFWADDLKQEQTAAVYIMDAGMNGSSPAAGAAIIDTESGRVQLLQTGRMP